MSTGEYAVQLLSALLAAVAVWDTEAMRDRGHHVTDATRRAVVPIACLTASTRRLAAEQAQPTTAAASDPAICPVDARHDMTMLVILLEKLPSNPAQDTQLVSAPLPVGPAPPIAAVCGVSPLSNCTTHWQVLRSKLSVIVE
jgi:hypothetical protein